MIEKKILCLENVEYKDALYFFMIDHNALCKLNKTTRTVDVIDIWGNGKYNTFLPYGVSLIANNSLFFAPHFSNEFFIYDLIRNETRSIILNDLIDDHAQKAKFCTGIVHGDELLFFGYKYPAIIKINSMDYSSVYMKDWLSKIPQKYKHIESEGSWYFGSGFVQRKENIYIPSGIGAGIWKIEMDSMEIDYIDTDIDSTGFWSIADYGDNFILTSSAEQDNRIFIWNIETRTTRTIELPKACYWNKPIKYSHFIIFLPLSPGGEVYRMNMEDYTFEVFHRLDGMFGDDRENAYVFCVKQNLNTLSFIRVSDRCWVDYSFDTDEIYENYYELEDEGYCNKCDEELVKERIDDSRAKGIILGEGRLSLGDYLKYLS